MEKLSDLINIGKEVERQLQQVGITNKDALESIGSKEAWVNIQSIDSSACINRLMALEGAIQGVRWHDLDSQTKENLKDFYNKHKLK